jgi:hypothetical protein
MASSIPRRDFLTRAGAAGIVGALSGCGLYPRGPSSPSQLALPPLRIAPDRISAITVCTRPFREQGPRLEAERRSEKTVIHHYGYGGSGWSLSWGYGYEAMQMALATGERDFAVIGCGAIGLTTAVLLARTGARVLRTKNIRDRLMSTVESLNPAAVPVIVNTGNLKRSMKMFRNLLLTLSSITPASSLFIIVPGVVSTSDDLVCYYQQLADTMQRLSKQYSAMGIDVAAMSEIEADDRKAIGADLAKDFAPVIGKTGVDFERERPLMFYIALNEQRHLTGVMVALETDPALKKFLEMTKAQLDARYAKVGALFNCRYFTQ